MISHDRFDPGAQDIHDSLSSNAEIPLNLQSFTFRDAGANSSAMIASKVMPKKPPKPKKPTTG